jgi:molecular chaperone HscB
MSDSDHFALFALPRRFAIDETALADAWRGVQAHVHPDRFATASAVERRVAQQWAARANDAYRILRSPLTRAAHLCELGGHPVDGDARAAMGGAFLQRQMTWRETLAEASADGDAAALARLDGEVAAERDAAYARLADLLDVRGDHVAAAAQVRELMFIDRFTAELADARERLDAGAAS